MEQSNYKAPYRTIYLGDISLEVFKLPNGEYCLSQIQVASVIDKAPESVIQFLDSEYFKVNGSSDCQLFNICEVALENANKPIRPIPIKVACLYWQKWSELGNSKAERLVLALLKQGLRALSDLVAT
ncbi:MAG: hypothetical protein AB4368_10465 [Xenococcaceae cyanobacterium]